MLSLPSIVFLSTWTAFVLLSDVAAGRDHERCPKNLQFTSKMEVYEDSCYQFVSVEKYWTDALTYCRQSNGTLVKIDSVAKNEFIKGILNGLYWKNDGIWIGLHDRNSELEWTWTSLTEGENETLTWSNWSPSHPGGLLHSRQDCVRMTREGGLWRWRETFCSTMQYKYRFICEYKAKPTSELSSSKSAISTEAMDDLPDYETVTKLGHIPYQAEVKSAQEETHSVTWMIIIGSSLFIILIIVIAIITVCRYKHNKKVAKFATVHNVLYTTVPTNDLQMGPSCNRPSCPLPPSCALLEDRIAQRDARARAMSNIYLNPAATSAYCDMNQSSNSIDKLDEASPYSPESLPESCYPEYSMPQYAQPHQYYNRAGPPCSASHIPNQSSTSEYMPMNQSDEYLCPKDSRKAAGVDTAHASDKYSLEGASETYSEPRVNNEYSEIAEAVYNNLYEALDEHA